MGLLCLPFFAFGFEIMFAFVQMCLSPPAPPPADLTFFLLNNSCLLTLKLDALETECLDGPQIPATYFLLQCANIRHSISTAGAEALAQLL